MVDAIVSFAVERLGSIITEEAAFLQNVRGEVVWLRDELRTIRSFLKDADKKQGEDNRIRQWVSQVRDVSYDAVDILEMFMIKFEEDKDEESCIMRYLQASASICKKLANLHDIGKEIESLKKRVSEISRWVQDYGITNIGHSSEGTSGGLDSKLAVGPISLRKTSSFAHEDDVIGFEDVAKTLMSELLKEGSSRSIVSIYGMGGLGKTTLARKLYNSLNVAHHFNYKAWVCVSQEFSIQDLLQRIIKSFKGGIEKEELDMLGALAEEDLKRYLRKFLEGHRYLVVIDDVWHESAYKTLSEAFPDVKNGSRIIITTRSEEVAIRADDKRFVHKLRFLTPAESWDLFCKKAFQGDRGVNLCTPTMQSIAKEMVGKCGGLPLAIIVLAGLLSYNSGLQDWVKVQNDIWQHLKRDSIEISELSTLSYNDLSSEIKLCFLYIGMFPEDYVIRVDRLIRMLIAEDFIRCENEEMEEVAEEFVNELIKRSLIQTAETRWEETVTCKVHDLLRDLAIEKAKEVNLFTIFDPYKSHSNAYLPSGRYTIHSESHIHSESQRYVSFDHSNRNIRALLFFTYDNSHFLEFPFKIMKFKLLRVLHLESHQLRKSKVMVEVIGGLSHLKFLGLSHTDIREIPSSIANLKSLQTLEVIGAYYCKLPREICNLKELRHLRGIFKGSLHIESLTNLRTLSTLDSQQLSELNPTNLSHLQELLLWRLDDTSSLHLIPNLHNLGTLVMSWAAAAPPLEPLSSCKRLLKLQLSGSIVKIPTSNELPPFLTSLILSNSKLVNDPMPVLERLPKLRSLELNSAYRGKKMVCSTNGFCQLEVLRVSGLWELEEWEVEQGAMPLIKGLRIHKCDKLKMIPEKLKFVSTVGPSVTRYFEPSDVS